MSDIHIRIEGRAGRITLNRPDALNAITWDMVRRIHTALRDWQDAPSIDLVLIDAAGDRAFCAGGDITEMYRTGRAGDFDYGRRFWADEYRLNAAIADYPKPYVALMHGFVMGGGVGISCHGSHRIVDESAQIAMPECAIGLIPDVGGSWLLSRAPGNFGAFIGLTGYRMGPEDAVFAGFADHFVPRACWPDLIRALTQTGDVAQIDQFAESPPEGQLASWPETSRWFRGQSVSEIVQDLIDADVPNAQKWADLMHRNSPLSLACALQTIRSAANLTLTQALQREYRFVSRCMEHGDFLEGIRAQVIDKDRTPHWRHDAPEAVTDHDVATLLAPITPHDLTFEE